MAIGPVQLIVLGFVSPDFKGEIIEELKRLNDTNTINVIDAIAVHKDADGNVTTERLTTLDEDEAAEFGAKVAALVGLGAAGEEGAMEFAEAGAEAAADGGIDVFADDEAWDVLGEIPPDTAAALVLIEHQWAVPLRDAIMRAHGFRLADAFISPFDLVAVGLMAREEAEELARAESQAQAAQAPAA